MNIVALSASWIPAMANDIENDFDLVDMENDISEKKLDSCFVADELDESFNVNTMDKMMNDSLNSNSNSRLSIASGTMDSVNASSFNSSFEPLPFEEQDLPAKADLPSLTSKSKRRSSMPSLSDFNINDLPSLPKIHFGDYNDKLLSSHSERPARTRYLDDFISSNSSHNRVSTSNKLLASTSERPNRKSRSVMLGNLQRPSRPQHELRRRSSGNTILMRRGSTCRPSRISSNQYIPEAAPSHDEINSFDALPIDEEEQRKKAAFQSLSHSESQSNVSKRRSSMPSMTDCNGLYGPSLPMPVGSGNANISSNYITNSLSVEIPNNNGKRGLTITTSISTSRSSSPNDRFTNNGDPSMTININDFNDKINDFESMHNGTLLNSNIGKQQPQVSGHTRFFGRRASMPSIPVHSQETANHFPPTGPIPSEVFSSPPSPTTQNAPNVGGKKKRDRPVGRHQQKNVPTQLSPDFVPSANDVICGRGKQFQSHAGNRRFKKIIAENVTRYVQALTKPEKSKVVISIVEQVRREAGNGGFVDRDAETGQWFEIGDALAREKVGHALRFTIRTNLSNGKDSNSSTTSTPSSDDKTKASVTESTVKSDRKKPSTVDKGKKDSKDGDKMPTSEVEEQIKSLKLKNVEAGEGKYRTIAEDAKDENFASFVLDTFLD